MALLDELRAVTAYIRAAMPGSTTALSHPTKPMSGLFVVRHTSMNSNRASAGAILTNRMLQVVLYHESEEAAYTQMDALYRKIGNDPMVSHADARVEITSLSFGSPVKLDTGLFGLVGTMGIRSHESTEAARNYGTEPLIAGVHATILD